MDILDLNGFSLRELDRINVLLGKNGCGKSFLLKQADAALTARRIGKVRYLSPERGGFLQYEAGIEQQLANEPNFLTGSRRQNQTINFRQQSVALFLRLERLVLLEIERDHTKPGYVPHTFDRTLEKLNNLLDRVQLERHVDRGFTIAVRETGEQAGPNNISSGESELISLGIEFLAFVKEAESGPDSFLLVDEPDVHLHPDLQDRLAGFIVEVLAGTPVTLVLATHSTALLGGLAERTDVQVSFMQRGDNDLTFKSVTEVDRAILPVFGAHPLSNVFNQAPILLIEGEDDERIWQQAVRSAQGRIRVYPCVVDGIARFPEYEAEVTNIIEAVYDDARGYSLRDRDLQPDLIDDVGHVIRMRLSCRAAENLTLADDVLGLAEADWPALQQRLTDWAKSNPQHQYHAEVRAFVDGGFDRRNHDLKVIRNIIVGLMSNKPWEVLVGQAIAHLSKDGGPAEPGSLREFLGEKVYHHLLRLPPDSSGSQPWRTG